MAMRPSLALLTSAWLVATLADGRSHAPEPVMIYGTAWKKERTAELVKLAIQQGFRAIDTANMPKHYNEAGVGEALDDVLADRDYGIMRKNLWIQSKFTPNACEGQPQELHPFRDGDPVAARVSSSLNGSLRHLRTEYLDSFLLHAPFSKREDTLAAWREMEKLWGMGLVRQIGVSNFNHGELAWLLGEAAVAPHFVQNRCLHKDGWDQRVRELCTSRGIRYQGFWLLSGNRLFSGTSAAREVGKRHSMTPEQVLFSFVTQGLGLIALSGTSSEAHMVDDLAVASGSKPLDAAELATLEALPAPKFSHTEPVSVTFRSALEEDASIVWHDEGTGKKAHNGNLPRGGELQVSTFHSHTFTTELSDGTVVHRWRADREHGKEQVVQVDGSLSVVFENRRGDALQVHWMSPAGDTVPQGTIEPMSELHLDTSLGHRFSVESADGRQLREWIAEFYTPGQQHVVIDGAQSEEL